MNLTTTDWLFIAAGLLVFSIISFWTISRASIWFDEAFGAYLIRFDFAQIARYTAADVHPPLYYWLLKSWSLLFGNTELALRSMSVFFGGIAIIFSYLLTDKLFNKKAARLSLLFLVLSPMIIRYSIEARMYMLVAAISIAATYMLVTAMETKRRRDYVVYGILVGLGMWTHYFAAIVWIAHWIWRADVIRRVSKKGKFVKNFLTRDWVVAHIVAVGLFIPWVPFFVYQLCNVQFNGFWIPPVSANTIVNFFTNVMFYNEAGNVVGWPALVFMIFVILMIVLAILVYKSLNQSRRQSYRLILAMAFVPIVLLVLLSMPPLRSSFVDRYLITSTFGFAVFIGVTLMYGLKKVNIKMQIVVILTIVAMMSLGIANVYHFGNYNKTTNMSNNTRQIIEKIVEKAGDGQPIIAESPWIFYEAVFYSTDNHTVYFLNDKTEYRYGSLDVLEYNDRFKIMDIGSFTQTHPTVWYVGRPGDGEMKAPYSNWRALQQVTVQDSINGTAAYRAVQYRVE